MELRDGRTLDFDREVSALIARVKEGDKDAFQDITRRYQRKVFVLAYAFFRDREEALDIVQETFLRLYEKAAQFHEGEDFQAWLFRIARNICIDAYRRARHRRTEQVEDARLEAFPADGLDCEKAERRSDLRALFRTVLDRLAARQRTVFVMKHYNEMPYQEIATTLGIAVGTVKSLHFKAVRNLRKQLGPHMGRAS